MIWVAGRSPTLVSQNLKATTLTYLAIEANQGLTQKEMGVILGVSHTTVGQALKKINFTRKHTLMKNETRKRDNNLSR
jgi:transcriptional antiterminator